MSTKFLQRVRPNKILNTKGLQIKMKKPLYKSAVLLLTSSTETNLNLIKSGLFQNNFIQVFYQNRFIDSNLTKGQNIQTARESLYERVVNETEVKRTVKVDSFIRNFSFYYDLSPELQFILNSPKFPNYLKKLEAFKVFLLEYIEKLLKTNEDLTLVFNSFKEINNPRLEKDNLISAFLFESIRENPSIFKKYKNLNILISSADSSYFFKIDLEDERGINLIRIKSLFKTITALENKIQLDTDDVINMSSVEQNPVTSSDRNELLDKNYYVISNKFSSTKIDLETEGFIQLYNSPIIAIIDRVDFESQYITSSMKDDVLTVHIPRPLIPKMESLIELFKTKLKGFKLFKVVGSNIQFSNTNLTKSSITKFEEINLSEYLSTNLDKVKTAFPAKQISFSVDGVKIKVVCDPDLTKQFFADNIYRELSASLDSRKNPSLSLTDLEVKNDILIKQRIDELVLSDDSRFSNVTTAAELNSLLKEILNTVQQDQVIKEAIDEINQSRKYSGRRILEKQIVDTLQAKQDNSELTLNSKKVRDIIQEFESDIKVDPIDIEVLDQSIKYNISDNLNSLYMSKYHLSDINSIITSFSKSDDQPIFVESADIYESSSEFDLKQTLEVKFNIPNSKPQVFRIDIPKFTADGYLYLNGGKKFVTKQFIPLPIIKIKSSGEDVVQFSTNYNKTFIGRMGNKVSPMSTNLVKFLKEIYSQNDNKYYITLSLSDSSSINNNFINSLEYNEIQRDILSLQNSDTGSIFVFNRVKMTELISKNELTDLVNDVNDQNKNLFPVGLNSKTSTIYFVDSTTSQVYQSSVNKTKTKDKGIHSEIELISSNLSKFIISTFSNEDRLSILSMPSTTKYMYSYTKIVNRKLPLIVYLGYMEGLDNIIDTYNIKTEFSETKVSSSGFSRSIPFKDGFLFFDDSLLQNSLLLSGLRELDTKSYSLADFNKKGVAYNEYFADIGVPNLGKALENFYYLFIDPITKSILKDLDLPTEMKEALLYCNTLLQSSIVAKKNDITNYRLRGAETVNAMLYKILADTVRRYRNASGSTISSVGITAKSNTLLQELAKSPIIEPVSTLNPVEEAMNRSKATYKGFGGSSFSHARGTEEIRAVDPSMNGIIAPTSTDDSKVGITRYLSMNPVITSVRGYISSDKRDLGAANKLNIAEMLAPFTPQHADPARQGMQTRQTAHIIPIVKNHKPLVGSGAERALAYSVGDEFVYKANEDGVVTDFDEKNQLVFIEYVSGKKSVIDLSPKNSRSSDGFYVTVQLKPKIKKGSKFKKNQILAQDTSFFSEDDATFNPGRLAKVVVAPLDLTFEDSSVISQSLADDMASYITYAKPISLSPNANLEKFKKKGESIKTSEPLMIFEEVFNDDTGSVSKLLDKLGSEFSETIEEFSKSTVLSKYSGEILDVKIYYNRELSEYSDSIRSLIESYIKSQKSRSDKIKSVDNDRIVNIPPIEKVSTNKVNGIEFDGILIMYYIRTLDIFRPGSKVTVSVALKSIVSSIFEKGEEPYSELDENENIDLVISPLSLSSRMVVDTYLLGYSNKALITLKNRIKSILDN